MSDALNFLVKARPEAMGHYFSFLKDAGKHLDPKTRDLISVITKVHAQTERGFRQYLGRALRDGCTPAEVLDALLMAFPALGLAKIVWAVDIILAMDLPEFQPAAMGAEGQWHDVMAVADLAPGGITRVDCDGRGLFVHHADDGWRVFDSRCPHQTTNIPHLALQGATLTCPKHGWVFDVRSGQCTDKGNSPLRRWESKVVDGRLLARW
ncbi:MAG: Rieske 2Fe-2S domain-containing protein [Aquincola sp.]|nr:Rieske 2Fe-2S domain-containing protein [Aquincola sp.]MDH4290390.1 Rieske 2Fe-2S domain-containing protein [Aquincola sp.]MDH5330988.1 Rieske 2Fe-2S domain-containing protein [Aquincola sp.]